MQAHRSIYLYIIEAVLSRKCRKRKTRIVTQEGNIVTRSGKTIFWVFKLHLIQIPVAAEGFYAGGDEAISNIRAYPPAQEPALPPALALLLPAMTAFPNIGINKRRTI
jgi:hypothetical protein